MEKVQLHLYEWKNNKFSQIAIIDDYQEYSFEHNLFSAGQFTVTINFNIPNAHKFKRGLFIKFGENDYDFGEISRVTDTLGENGKGSQIRQIFGYDARYLLKRRVIKNMNDGGKWSMTAKGELCLRNLVKDQCGSNAEEKRRLPVVNTIPLDADAIGKEYSVSEEFSNLYEVCKTIATQSEIGWRMKFNTDNLILECYSGEDLHNSVFFSPDFDSLASGNFSDSTDAFSNTIYVAGKGQNENRDLYEGEKILEESNLLLNSSSDDILLLNNSEDRLVLEGIIPVGLERFESFDNQSEMTTESEYEAEAFSMLSQYGQTIEMNGQGLVKCPYVFREQYNIGDKITLSFNNQKSVVQILSVTERSVKGNYALNFQFGKPQNTLTEQLQIMLRKIQMASNKTNAIDSVKWYEVPDETEMSKSDVTFNTLGFTGAGGSTFTLYLSNDGAGSKRYFIYCKNLEDDVTLTTGTGGTNLVLEAGTYVTSIYIDTDGNILQF